MDDSLLGGAEKGIGKAAIISIMTDTFQDTTWPGRSSKSAIPLRCSFTQTTQGVGEIQETIHQLGSTRRNA
jgi:hypothetical protein